jgi:hypothetical protein
MVISGYDDSTGARVVAVAYRNPVEPRLEAHSYALPESDCPTRSARPSMPLFAAEDGSTLWCGGYAPADEDGFFLTIAEHRQPVLLDPAN